MFFVLFWLTARMGVDVEYSKVNASWKVSAKGLESSSVVSWWWREPSTCVHFHWGQNWKRSTSRASGGHEPCRPAASRGQWTVSGRPGATVVCATSDSLIWEFLRRDVIEAYAAINDRRGWLRLKGSFFCHNASTNVIVLSAQSVRMYFLGQEALEPQEEDPVAVGPPHRCPPGNRPGRRYRGPGHHCGPARVGGQESMSGCHWLLQLMLTACDGDADIIYVVLNIVNRKCVISRASDLLPKTWKFYFVL